MERYVDVIIIGGGQSGLAAGYYMRRSGLSFVILDREDNAGGSWQHHWNSLRLFSPAQWSSLPGVIMNGGSNYYPSRDETIQYLKDYEAKYQLPVLRPVDVYAVTKQSQRFQVTTSVGAFHCNAVVSATGSFSNPVVPEVTGMTLSRDKYFTHRSINRQNLSRENASRLSVREIQARRYWPKFLSWRTPSGLHKRSHAFFPTTLMVAICLMLQHKCMKQKNKGGLTRRHRLEISLW